MPIAVDLPLVDQPVRITGVADGTTWTPDELSVGSGVLTLWADGLPDNADKANVRS